jgi:hypothetical protein
MFRRPWKKPAAGRIKHRDSLTTGDCARFLLDDVLLSKHVCVGVRIQYVP